MNSIDAKKNQLDSNIDTEFKTKNTKVKKSKKENYSNINKRKLLICLDDENTDLKSEFNKLVVSLNENNHVNKKRNNLVDNIKDIKINNDKSTINYHNDWQEEIIALYSNYSLLKTIEYTDKITENIKILAYNIPTYLHNKKSYKMMIKDYKNDDSLKTLKKLIDFTVYDNSIINAIKNVFGNHKISKRYNDYLYNKYIKSIYEALYNEEFL